MTPKEEGAPEMTSGAPKQDDTFADSIIHFAEQSVNPTGGSDSRGSLEVLSKPNDTQSTPRAAGERPVEVPGDCRVGKTSKAAQELIRRGFAVVPVPAGSKVPILDGWPDLRITAGGAPTYFPEVCNIGILCGEASGGLVDIDLDCDQALEVATALLPPTQMRHGRKSNPESHRWYVVEGIVPSSAQFHDPRTKQMLLELRANRLQTIVPPSTHPSGEQLVWYASDDPARIPAEALVHGAAITAVASLAAKYWPASGARHNCALALSGLLLRRNLTEQLTIDVVTAAAKAAGDEEWRDRATDVKTTAARLRGGDQATGLPRLAEIVGEDIAAQIGRWLPAERELPGFALQRGSAWPADLDRAALTGIAGDFVKLVAPETEADPVALLVQFLVAFGSLIGRGSHFVAEADRHYSNLYAILIGQTSKARKGTSWGHVRKLMGLANPDWSENRIMSGLSSGEGLISNVRDAQYRNEEIKAHGKRTGRYEEVRIDQGVEDKRLLVVESEFASVLRVLEREGNTLSGYIRQAWDSGDLRVLNKNSPLVATGAHISIIGHITADELKRYLNRTEAGNGFANRFLWLCVRRSKCLPEGGNVPDTELLHLAERLQGPVKLARKAAEIRRSADARTVWAEVYPHLSEGRPGLAGALIARAEAQVMRLACLYALLDESESIEVTHLMAALALWTYADQSVRFVFGDSLGDPLADEILNAVRAAPQGLTRSQIRDLFSRNVNSSRIETVIVALEAAHLVRREMHSTDGRPAERIFAINQTTT